MSWIKNLTFYLRPTTNSGIRFPVFVIVLILTGNVNINSKVQTRRLVPDKFPRLIAHAGGDINGMKLTNSRQALNQSYREGFRYFELDISKTSDGIPFLVHDWNYGKVLAKKDKLPVLPTYKQIKAVRTYPELLDLHKLTKWIRKHEDAFIITDVKDNNLEILRIIKENFPELFKHVIPQIYCFEEYALVRGMGYSSIILTLYRTRVSDEKVISFCQKNALFGLTVSSTRATREFLKKCSVLKIPVYVHTVNNVDVYKKLRYAGAYGIYTDYFQPHKLLD